MDIGLPTLDDQAYVRRRWDSVAGDHYYTWKSSSLPNWFGASQAVWNEASRLEATTKQISPVAYHYTDMGSFLKIVESRTLWLSDYSYLNDKTELLHGLELVDGVIADIRMEETNEDALDLYESWSRSCREGNSKVYIASFSADGDNLSQWRAYGEISIGFDVGELAFHGHQARLGPVEYSRDVQRLVTRIQLNHLKQAYLADLSDQSLERIPDVYHRVGQILEIIGYFKNSSFSDERELRLVFVEHPELRAIRDSGYPERRFRVSGRHVLPYVSSEEIFPSPDSTQRPLGISEVIVGPAGDELVVAGIREFLSHNDMGHVTVRKSQIPFRSR